MLGLVAMSTPISLSSPTKSSFLNSRRPRNCFPATTPVNLATQLRNVHHAFRLLSTFPRRRHHFSLQKDCGFRTHFSPKAASSSSGYREKVFAIIGVKVYAAGLYVNQSIISKLDGWKGRLAAEIQEDSSLFDSIFQAPPEKSLHIVLVRDVDGKTFWDALDNAISPRIKTATPVDESALSTFRSIFQGRPLKKGTFIFLTWLDPGKMLVCISSDGLPSSVDAQVESMNVTLALFDVFFGGDPVSPSLKASVANGLATMLKIA